MADTVHDEAHAIHSNKQFPRGAKPTPKHVVAAAEPFCPIQTLIAPTQFAVVPPKLSMWCNGPEGNLPVSGDCVTAQEAYSKAVWSIMMGMPELFIPPLEVERWAKKYGFWNGADLGEVMDQMAQDGFTVNGVNYHDGPKLSVNYASESVLQPAIIEGPINIAIDASALSNSAGNVMGWFSTGGSPGQYPNTDHCVAISGFGTAEYLYQQLGVAMPASLAGKSGYLLYTWSTIGFVDHAWLMSTCVEAWLRNPTTPEQVGPPNPPLHVCPVGQHWDDTKQMCVIDTPVPVSPGVVAIPQLTVRIFGLGIGHTDAVTVPVTQPTKSVNWGGLIADSLQLAVDLKAKNWAGVFADIAKIAADLTASSGQSQIRAINWGQLLTDVSKLYTDVMAGAGWSVLWADLKAIVADLGF